MSNEPLHGYSVDDDDPHNESHISSSQPQSLIAESEIATVPHTGDGTPTTTTSLQQQQQPQSTTTTAAAVTSTIPTSPDWPSATDEFADPKIASLHSIFPDFDAAILYSVVDSVNGDQDRAVDALLSMSDPNHVPSSSAGGRPPTQTEPSLADQTQLDEEFARQLMLEDEERYARNQIAFRQQQQQSRQQYPYATRVPPQQQQQASSVNNATTNDAAAEPQQRDTMSDVQEHFSKLAETGKRTFTSFVSKVKAKVQEFDQSRNAQAQQQQQNNSSDTTGPTTTAAAATTSRGDSSDSSFVLDRHAQQAYYAPRVNPNSLPAAGYTVHGDDDERAPRRASSLPASSTPAAVVHDDSAADSAIQPPPMTRSGPPPSNIDPGKIGLLPKRPVSLVNTKSPFASHVQDEEEDDLEYVENPFEEGRYS